MDSGTKLEWQPDRARPTVDSRGKKHKSHAQAKDIY